MQVPTIKNSIRITFTAIDGDGNEAISSCCVKLMEEIVNARAPVLALLADREARKFQEACAGMGIFGQLTRGEK